MAAPRGDIRLQFAKFDGSEHWGADLQVLGEDEHGTWLGAATGTRYEHPVKVHDTENDPAHVVLLPRDDWWVATFNASPAGRSRTIEVYVDIATPPTIAEGEVFSLDLDLDVVRRVGGIVELLDEDEFAEHSAAMAYPPRVVAAARESAQQVLRLVRTGAAPFDGSHERWLRQVR